MFSCFKSRRKTTEPRQATTASKQPPSTGTANATITPPSKQFVSDEPISGANQDRFNRAPFASRIAHTIALRPDPSSLVVGVFGPWGDGKTSVLKMMEEELQRHDHVVVLHFNPWHFPSEEQLIRGFFATLADGLDRKLNNAKEKIGKVLKDYGSLLSIGSVVLGGAVTLRPGDAAKGVGEAMSNVGLDELRSRIETFLAESGKRVVVLVDDIDRLDRTETHSMFKLVKLSAGFNHTSYVLAFDDEVVAAALGERYGAGGQQAGRAFLEKIIQVPLHLPPVDTVSLRLVAFEGVEAALSMADIELKQTQVDAFIRHFVDGLEPRLSTPRVAKLYTNALMFALPLLKGEVNIMNLMLVEGIRVLYPGLYAAIRDNPSMFLESHHENRGNGFNQVPTPFDQLVDGALPSLTTTERETIKDRLLRPLFPRTGNMQYGHEWDNIWAQEQRICAAGYFKRYFSYCVPDGDVSDASVNALMEGVVDTDDEGKRALIEAFGRRRSADTLVSVLRQRSEQLPPECAGPLARAIALSGALFPQERGMYMLTTRMQASILVKQLMKRLPAGPVRWAEIESVLEDATPLPFAAECIRWLRHDAEGEDDRNVVEADDNPRMESIVAQRIAQAHDEQPAYVQFGRDAPSLLWLWNRVDAEGSRVAVRRRFDLHPEEVDAYLDCHVGEGWEIESGLPVRGRFERRHFDEVDRIVGAEYVMDNLARRYGDDLDSPQEYPPQEWLVARKVAHQFTLIYRHVRQSQPAAAQEAGAASPD
ncbi:KAP family NTPase [Chromobacterium piscinae]|uniref:KAP family P-loop NTPase fold protein n=1 Tax=Chromobacterium piscinae TaxID=686831 RepID=UPI001E3AFB1C|nr:P-loop NTPase fold protein [Chromobacterium piscinae]MCD4506755.1 KAP family NTPase [Chromobacterium piscinae]